MKRSNRLILLIGFFLAAVAFVAVVMLLGSGTGGGGNEPGVDALNTTIVVTTADVPLGTTLTADLVTTQDVKNTEKPAGSYTLTSEVIGRTVTTQLTKGQLLDGNAFSTTTVNPDIARLLDPGLRAMSLEVSYISGVGTLIKPGDRVDVVVGISGAAFPIVTTDPTTDLVTPVTGYNPTSVKAIVQNLEVVGTLLPYVPPAEGEAPPPGPSSAGGRRHPARDPGRDRPAGRGAALRPVPGHVGHPDPPLPGGQGRAGREDDRHHPSPAGGQVGRDPAAADRSGPPEEVGVSLRGAGLTAAPARATDRTTPSTPP